MAKDKKDFFNVAELSEQFGRFQGDTIAGAGADKIDGRTQLHFQLIMWQIRAQLAIAQQLSMISKHLGEITAECERAASEAKQAPGK